MGTAFFGEALVSSILQQSCFHEYDYRSKSDDWFKI